MVKVSWSNQFAVAVEQINVHSIKEKRVPLSQKLSTFEGPVHLVENHKITSELQKGKLEQITDKISQHIIAVSGGNIHIVWMTLYFKMDKQGHWWLLFCSRIKVRDYVSTNCKSKFEVLEVALPQLPGRIS